MLVLYNKRVLISRVLITVALFCFHDSTSNHMFKFSLFEIDLGFHLLSYKLFLLAIAIPSTEAIWIQTFWTLYMYSDVGYLTRAKSTTCVHCPPHTCAHMYGHMYVTIPMHRHRSHTWQAKRAKSQGDTQPNTSYVPPALVWYKMIHPSALKEHHTITFVMHRVQRTSLSNCNDYFKPNFNVHPRQGEC